MADAKLGKELCFEAADKVGLLNELCTSCTNAGVNIATICAYKMGEKASFMMVTSDNAKAAELLRGMGHEVKENDVVLYELENTMGAAAEMTKKLAGAGVNMEYLYGTTGTADAPALMVFNSDNNAKAVEVLNS